MEFLDCGIAAPYATGEVNPELGVDSLDVLGVWRLFFGYRFFQLSEILLIDDVGVSFGADLRTKPVGLCLEPLILGYDVELGKLALKGCRALLGDSHLRS
jgi:hypothetical protein